MGQSDHWPFLSGGGELASLIAAHDWSATSLGAIAAWPQSLKTTLALILRSHVPIVTLWGEDGVMIYNDAYSVFAGGRHPQILGSKVREGWPEVADFNDNVMKVGLAGDTLAYKDQTLTLNRTGKPEPVWMNLDYSPLLDEAGKPAGVMAIVVETTEKVRAEQWLQDERARLRQMFQQAPGFMTMLRGPEHVFDLANPAYLQLTGHRDLLHKPIREALPELAGQGFFELLDQVYSSGKAFSGIGVPVGIQHVPGGPVERRYVDFVYQPIRSPEDEVVGIFVEGADVTDRVLAEQAVRKSEARNRQILDSAIDYAIIAFDLDGKVTRWNEGAHQVLGWTEREMLGLDCGRIFTPEDRAAGRPEIEMRCALEQGVGSDERWHLRKSGERFWAIGEMTPIRDDAGEAVGFVKVLRDRTDEHRAEEALRQSEARLRRAQEAGGVGIFSIGIPSDTLVVTPEFCRIFGLEPCDTYVVDVLEALVIPDDQQVMSNADSRASQTAVLDVEYRIRRADTGELRWIARKAEYERDEAGQPVRLVGVVQDITERRAVQRAIEESAEALADLNATLEQRVEERTRERDRAWKNSRDLQVVTSPDGYFTAANEAWRIILGWAPEEVIGQHHLRFVHPEDQQRSSDALVTASREELAPFENRVMHKDGSFRWISWVAAPEDNVVYASGRNITAEKAAEAELEATQQQLRQSQKMEAVGQLTGGIAHDFNNLLQGITGSLDLLQKRISQGRYGELDRFISGAMQSAGRASALTHRLLAFSRRQPLDPRPVRANPLVVSMEDLLRRTLGERIELELVTAGGLWLTRCDPNQLESAILNLVINARDAMPNGGKLTIETCNTHLDAAYAVKQREVKPGQYVCICVTDTGTGMSADTIAKAFEPFFTTKPIGQGTGLGLSMIYGFARQSDGHAQIYSEEGKGTTVKLYLPRHRGAADEDGEAPELNGAHAAEDGETVLVVEDEPVVRGLIIEVLTDLGYRALEAGDGPAGLELLQSKRRIDLMITDIGLPGLNGRQIADAGRELRPDLKVLFMTGYAENAALASGFLQPGMAMITKPFAMEALATRIRDIIGKG